MKLDHVKGHKISVIDWSSISNINRLIGIDCYRLISIIIDYRLVTSIGHHEAIDQHKTRMFKSMHIHWPDGIYGMYNYLLKHSSF